MIPAYLSGLANHLWQSTLFAAVAALLALALRKNCAQARYWLWLAASVKFLVPFSLLVAVGRQFEWRTAPAVMATPLSVAIETLTPAALPAAVAPSTPSAAFPIAAALLFAIWLCGCVGILSVWCVRWRRIRAAVRTASPLHLSPSIERTGRLAPVVRGYRIEAVSSAALLEPGVFGVFRPVLLLPDGIADRLTKAQLDTILAHELCHVRRRDNLAAAIHMIVEAVFWFHPLVWWIGARLVDERERACDEEVLRQGSEPEVYAEGIVNVCKFYLESPLVCSAGVTGANLKKRIEAIMTHRISGKLSPGRKLLLASAAALAVAGPVVIGLINAPASRAQSPAAAAAPPAFEVATIKPSDPSNPRMGIQIAPGGRFTTSGITLKFLIGFAYDVRDFQVSGGPGWVNSDKYDIVAKAADEPDAGELRKLTDDQGKAFEKRLRLRVQALLADRFQLKIQRTTKELPVYALLVAKSGSKLQETQAAADGKRFNGMRMGRGELTAQGAPIKFLTQTLSQQLGRPVLDQTGLTGKYDFKLAWSPDPSEAGNAFGKPGPGGDGGNGPPPPDPNGPSIFTAVQEQLGLKLESQKGPVEILVIDKVEKPSEN
jgi:bla regulator protein blaR1